MGCIPNPLGLSQVCLYLVLLVAFHLHALLEPYLSFWTFMYLWSLF